MSRKPQVGDTVRVTGTVVSTNSVAGWVGVSPSDDGSAFSVNIENVEVMHPAEPPVGSVVVKGGVAYRRSDVYFDNWYPTLSTIRRTKWPEISDGEIVFVPGV